MITKYSSLERGARQGDPISAYLFIIALKVLFVMVKKNVDIKPLEILNKTFFTLPMLMMQRFFLKVKIQLSFW